MIKKKNLYLAGPEVFLPDAQDIGDKKIKICSEHGFTGIYPVDNEPLPRLTGSNLGFYICRKNKQKIKMSSGVIANITPFRSISIDPGTAYEIGYADALSRPIFAYTNSPDSFVERTVAAFGGAIANDIIVDNIGMLIENFGLVDNLMIDGAIHDSTKTLLVSDCVRELEDLELFERAVVAAKSYFDRQDEIRDY